MFYKNRIKGPCRKAIFQSRWLTELLMCKKYSRRKYYISVKTQSFCIKCNFLIINGSLHILRSRYSLIRVRLSLIREICSVLFD